MIEFLMRGGPVMVPLLLSSVVALGLIIERIWALSSGRVTPAVVCEALRRVEGEERVDQLLRACAQMASPLSRIISQGFYHRDKTRQENIDVLANIGRKETLELERGLVTLEIIAGVSPLLGLLGTVLGMVNVFDVISIEGVGQATMLSKGISEALVTTITGLSIAIPTLAAFNYLTKRVDQLTIELERQTTIMLNKIYGKVPA